ncbi:MAG: CAP domain-containing protein [Acidobacteria bacterium]|nr:CAP domain-containing protein [Acidobacteriota bacterium]
MIRKPFDWEIGAAVRLLWLINDERQAYDLEPLAHLKSLDMAAWRMATDMRKPNHVRGDKDSKGRGPSDRAIKEGYLWTPVHENRAYCAQSPQAAVKNWMANPEDQGNILGSAFVVTGVACRSGHYVQVFGSRRG